MKPYTFKDIDNVIGSVMARNDTIKTHASPVLEKEPSNAGIWEE